MRAPCLALALLAVTTSCGGEESSAASREATGKSAAADGAMCAEHGVLEAICTKCNPKLVPVFQAKGDWCAEHGFPESVCPICHPERGGKPAADVSTDGAPPDGTKVRFRTKETARLAGIETAVAAPSSADHGLQANARIAYDATRVAAVNARAPGVVRTLRADVGSKVKKGAPLATIQSGEVGGARSHLDAARTRVRIAEANHKREVDLQAKKISAQKDVLVAEQELEQARAELRAIQAGLGLVGGGEGGSYTLTAPISGVVTERNTTVGNMVGTETPLFRIVDTSVMWAELEVPETELALVAVGQKVAVTLDGGGERSFAGTISYVAPEIDPTTRTAVVRVPLDNPDGALRANLFGQARIAVDAAPSAAVVPRAAVQQAKGVHLVFVRKADDEYEARRVQVARVSGDQVEILKGVKPGEPVVTEGSFLLKTETLKESIGAGCCDVE